MQNLPSVGLRQGPGIVARDRGLCSFTLNPHGPFARVLLRIGADPRPGTRIPPRIGNRRSVAGSRDIPADPAGLWPPHRSRCGDRYGRLVDQRPQAG